MFAKERRNKILDLLYTKGAVTSSELMDFFDVSIETVRRDLLELEKQGKISRVHGGAMLVSEMKKFIDLPSRIEDNKDNKIALCETAVMFVKDNDIIAVDSGSTAIYFAHALKKRNLKLTVITHSVDVFEILNNEEKINVILCGGHYLKKEKAFYGTLTLDMLSRLHAGKAFLFPSAISVNRGIMDFNNELAQVQERMLYTADKVYFLADSDKFEKSALIKICDMSSNHIYITDSNFNMNYKTIYSNAGYNVVSHIDEVNEYDNN